MEKGKRGIAGTHMKGNKYDDAAFSGKYSRMPRSGDGLAVAGAFSVEHPVFTAQGPQGWHGNHPHWPVDGSFSEGVRKAVFLGEEVMKCHRPLTTYVNGLFQNGFELRELVEPQPESGLWEARPEIMRDELRRPMMLLVSARKR